MSRHANEVIVKRRLQRVLLACPGFAALCRLLTRNHVRVLMYHRFAPDASNERAVGAPMLRTQAKLIARHHDLWTPDDHLDHLEGKRPGGRCPVVVTCDDGYADFHAIAFPVFRDQRIPAMLFVATGFVDGHTWFWWDRLAHLLAAAPGWRGEFTVGDRDLVLDLTGEETRARAWNAIADRCRFLPDARKEETLRRLAATLGVDPTEQPAAGYEPVTWDQVREMAAAGILFGAHTVTHPILSRVPVAEAGREIAASRERIETATGATVRWFAYPQGGPADWNVEVRGQVIAAGLRGCYVAYQNLLSREDPYALPRYCVQSDPLHFRWLLCGAEWLILQLRQRIGLPTAPGADYWTGTD
jgi:peptidoglycan/xylan/chitin deacetylase (PgdA/CDA1 family)